MISIASAARQNTILKSELRQYKAKLKLFDELVQENARLRSTLGYKGNSPYSFGLLPSEVISRAPSPWYTVFEINRGHNSDVRPGAAVIFREGLVGRVLAVTPFSAKIMILTDAHSSIAAVDSRSRDFGVVEGGTGNQLFMRYVGAGANIQVGDKIITSNLSTLFPPGIPIGTVTKIKKQEQELFYQIEIKPAVDLSKLEEVFIVI